MPPDAVLELPDGCSSASTRRRARDALLPAEVGDIVRRIRASAHLRLDGGHVHIGSQIVEDGPVRGVGRGPRRGALGRHCESGDQLVCGAALPRPAVADLVRRDVEWD